VALVTLVPLGRVPLYSVVVTVRLRPPNDPPSQSDIKVRVDGQEWEGMGVTNRAKRLHVRELVERP
jgi:hypothetical protein